MREIEWQGEILQLLPERAAMWPREKTLILSDTHFGKDATFRQHGIPIPGGTNLETLDRLYSAVRKTGPDRLILLGDLFHSKASRSSGVLDSIEEWVQSLASIEVHLVRGNHDRHAGGPPDEWGWQVHESEFRVGPFTLRHDPLEDPETPTLSGHLHPVLHLMEERGAKLRMPCFWLRGNQLVLPALGAFTGGWEVRPADGDGVYAVGPNNVVDVSRGFSIGA
jgi:DNA ligase-associated metallophosphoesterase